MDYQPLVSVIVPIYRVEHDLERCVESARAQTYRNIEMILVDDGSPDGCPALCDQYAAKDARIRVIHQENGGVSAARNAGTAIAEGEFVFYLDADDQILPDTIETLFQMRSDFHSDISIVQFATTTDGLPSSAPADPDAPVKVMSAREALIAMLYQKEFDTSAWGKLIPLETARRFPFPEGRVFEDLATVYRWLTDAETVSCSGAVKYLYTLTNEGIVGQSYSMKSGMDEKRAMDELYEAIMQVCPEAIPAARARRFSTYCHILLTLRRDQAQSEEFLRTVRSTLKQDCRVVWKDRGARLKNRAGAIVYLVTGERGIRFLFAAIRKFVSSADRNLNRAAR